MKSREELVRRALRELGVPGAGQQPSAEDVRAVEQDIDTVLRSLAVRGVYLHGDTDAIDDEAFVPLAVLLAASVARQFGASRDPAAIAMAEQELRVLRPAPVSDEPVKAWYF